MKAVHTAEVEVRETKKARLLNGIIYSLIFGFILLLFVIYFTASPESRNLSIGVLFLVLLMLFICLYLNKTNRIYYAFSVLEITFLIITTSVTCVYGIETFAYNFYFLTIILPFLFINEKRTIYIYLIVNILLMLFAFLFVSFYEPIYGNQRPFYIPVIISMSVFLIITAIVIIFKRENSRHEAELIKRNETINLQAVQLKKSDEMKSKLYANISHEFRTPLTLISGPIQKLLESEKDPKLIKTYRDILSNSQQLTDLINQMLELSKFDMDKQTVELKETEILKILKRSMAFFESYALSRKIEFTYSGIALKIFALVDKEKIQMVFTNLLSNAFKYSPDNGKVSVKLSLKDDQNVEIIFSDSGSGIPENEKDKIFDRFYKLQESEIGELSSSGIGLELCKELIEMHKGSINVESKIGLGSNFIVTLPIVKTEIQEEQTEYNLSFKDDEPKKTQVRDVEGQEVSDEMKIILLVEDNADMLQYLRDILADKYSIIDAPNGKAALPKAINTIPDLIISDIMMPEMNGIEFCKQIRKNEKTQHIPLIMLTAKTNLEAKIEGLDSGADDYLAKPFNHAELQTKIKNILLRQERLIKSQSGKSFFNILNQETQSSDEVFLKKIAGFIENNISNSDFGIEQLSNEAAYSRSQLFRKLKALTGLSPNEFIRNTRIHYAAKLLKQKAGSISEIAYLSGFSKPAYFSECFKKLYGCTPSEYIDS